MNQRPLGLRFVFGAVAVVAVAVLVQWYRCYTAVVPSFDATHFVRAANRIASEGPAALADLHQQPVFPLVVFATQQVYAIAGLEVTPAGVVQTAAGLAVVLLTIPAMILAWHWYEPRLAIPTGLVIATLPPITQLGAEGLSDGWHLLFVACALTACVPLFSPTRERSSLGWAGLTKTSSATKKGDRATACLQAVPPANPVASNDSFDGTAGRQAVAHILSAQGWALLVGLCLGLAWQTRLESIVFAPWIGLAILWPGQQSLGSRMATLATLGLGILIASAPLVALTGDWVPKYWQTNSTAIASSSVDPAAILGPGPSGEGLNLAAKDSTQSVRRFGLAAAVRHITAEVPQSIGPLAAVLAIIGYWLVPRTRLPRLDAVCVASGVSLIIAATLYSARSGYLSERHLSVLPFLLATSVVIGAAAVVRTLARISPAWTQSPGQPRFALAAGVALVLTASLLESSKPLHPSRSAHRAAGEWLAEAAASDEAVFDTRGLTGLYSGRASYLSDEAGRALLDPRLRFVVVEDVELTSESDRAKSLAWLLEQHAEVAEHFPAEKARNAVTVFRWHPPGVAVAAQAPNSAAKAH
jgi:hypothetical protein